MEVIIKVLTIESDRYKIHAGLVNISPVVQKQLLCAGGQLVVTCITNESALLWRFSLYNRDGTLRMRDRFITSEDISMQPSDLTINSTLFHFVRLSPQHHSPLMATMSVINVSTYLNGTEIECVGADPQVGEKETASTMIYVITMISNSGI